MVFSSNIFLFLFLPVFLAVYYAVPFRWRSLIILIGSYVFYAWWRIDFLFVFIGITLWTYAAAHLIVRSENQGKAKRWLVIGTIGNLLTLGFFKYFNFGIDSLNMLLSEAGFNSIDVLRVILPIGISFYVFHSISILVDLYRKDAPPVLRFLDFAAFIALFPQLVAGPVLRYKDIAPQFISRRHGLDLFSHGAYRFMLGFAKKVLIADSVSPLVDASFGLAHPSMADAWLGALAYTIQLYFDFSGYSDMAVGLGLMMGFQFFENFDRPYTSRSITEFWRRWHISLSTWLKDYLYIPLGGNRKGTRRTYFNLLITMVLGGLWHGANWTFVIWGAWHGALLATERALGSKGLGLLATMLFVIMGWVMFRAENVMQAFSFYGAMIGTGEMGLSDALAWQVTGTALTALFAGIAIVYAVPAFEKDAGIELRNMRTSKTQIMSIALFVVAVIKLTAQSYSPFLYFQF